MYSVALNSTESSLEYLVNSGWFYVERRAREPGRNNSSSINCCTSVVVLQGGLKKKPVK